MNTKVMEYILAIAEEKSITRAAERFYLSHADLSRHLRNVEKEMGAPLFTRTQTGVQLTQAGIIFVSDAQAVLHMESELEKSLAEMRGEKRRHIRVMTDSPFYNDCVRLAGPAFQAKHPQYTLEFVNCNAFQARRALLDGTADLGVFGATTAKAADLEYFGFGSSDVCLAFPPDYPGTADIAGLKAAVEGGMFLSLYPVGTTMRVVEERQLAAQGILPQNILEASARDVIEQVCRGEACGLVVSAYAAAAGANGSLRLGDVFFRLHHVIAYSTKHVLSAVYQDLMEAIMKAFAENFQ